MFRKAAKFAMLPALLTLLASAASAQVGSLRGNVVGADGEGVRGALIQIERTDIKGNYEVKTKKKGQWFHAGLPLGTYNVSLVVDGKTVDALRGVRVGMGDNDPINFDLGELQARQQQAQQAASAGQTPSEEQLKSMSAEERKQYEEALKQRQQQLSKNKELNEAFNAGMAAKQANDFQTAVDQLAKAVALDATQDVVWANLADVQTSLAGTKTGAERDQLLNDAVTSYGKAIELKAAGEKASPQELAAYHNNLGLAQIKAGNMEAGQAELSKAAQMDPANGGRYYFNLWAVMINSGNTEAAIEAFQKATQTQPDYADAYYQLGTALVGKAQTKEDGSVEPVPGTIEAFQKYIELKPDGPYAANAQMMIQTLSGGVETTFTSPDAKKK